MESTVRLYSSKIGEISKFLNEFFNNSEGNDEETEHNKNIENYKEKHKDIGQNKMTGINKRTLEWEKSYRNPVEIADIIGALIENNDKFHINMWISIDEGLFINVTDYNADEIIRYLYERFPW